MPSSTLPRSAMPNLVTPTRTPKLERARKARWYGHVERKGEDDWVRGCRSLKMGNMKQGRPLKSWYEVLKEEMKVKDIDEEWAEELVQNKKGWRDAYRAKSRAEVWEVLVRVREEAGGLRH